MLITCKQVACNHSGYARFGPGLNDTINIDSIIKTGLKTGLVPVHVPFTVHVAKYHEFDMHNVKNMRRPQPYLDVLIIICQCCIYTSYLHTCSFGRCVILKGAICKIP